MGIVDVMQDDFAEKVNAFKSAFSSEEKESEPLEADFIDPEEGK
jgi:hypothetical protein